VIAATANEAPYVLDGLLYHQSNLVINEHYTDTGGFSDHVFAMCRLLGFRFVPRIRDLKEKRLYVLPGMTVPPELASLAAGAVNLRVISDHWFELLRLALSIKTGTVTASVILRKLAAYPRHNGLALALRELGKLERTLFTLQWLHIVATSASTRASSKMRSAAPYSSTDSAKSATAPTRTSATARAV
jgi:TnpA family transposase